MNAVYGNGAPFKALKSTSAFCIYFDFCVHRCVYCVLEDRVSAQDQHKISNDIIT